MTENEDAIERREAAFLHEVQETGRQYGPEGARTFFQNLYTKFSGRRNQSFARTNVSSVSTPNKARTEMRNAQSDKDFEAVLDQAAEQQGVSEELLNLMDELYEIIKKQNRANRDGGFKEQHDLQEARTAVLDRLYAGPLALIYSRLRALGYNHYDITGITDGELEKELAKLKRK